MNYFLNFYNSQKIYSHIFFFFQTDQATLLRKSIKVHTESAIREAIHLIRLAIKYKILRKGHKNEGRDPSLIILFDNGYFTTVSGDGELFDVFCRDKTFGQYTGRNYKVKKTSDAEYRTAKLRFLPFDHCFHYSEDDVNSRKSSK